VNFDAAKELIPAEEFVMALKILLCFVNRLAVGGEEEIC
jgi:hypothetical protein